MNTHDDVLVEEQHGSDSHERLIRVWLVDDNDAIRDLMSSVVQAEDGFACPQQFPSADAALQALARQTPPDVILMDVEMPGLNGVDAVREVKTLAASTHVFILTTFYDHDHKTRALRDGASGFFLKSHPTTTMLEQIRRAKDRPALSGIVFDPVDISGREEPSWPMRRAPALKSGRSGDDAMAQMHPDKGRRKTPWRCASSRLVRGVSHLRNLFKFTH